MIWASRGRVMPIAVLVFILTVAASCSIVAASVSILHATGKVTVSVPQALLAAAPATLVIAIIAALANVRTTRAVQRMQARVSTVDALQRRVRIADDVAERYRRNAETASAGMFELLAGLVAAEEGPADSSQPSCMTPLRSPSPRLRCCSTMVKTRPRCGGRPS